MFPVIIILIEACIAFYLCYRTGALSDNISVIITSILVSFAFLLRYAFLRHITADYSEFLSNWVVWFKANSGFFALKETVGNYNIPYLYFLALFSYFEISDLYLIKALSIFFDILLAWSVSEIVMLVKKDCNLSLFAFIAVLLMPTVILNSSYWAQCDSIYSAFGICSIYFALSYRPKCSMVFLALSFSFKLQSVFIMPVFLLLLFNSYISFKDLFIFPATYFLIILPAVILGHPISDALGLYVNQIDSIGIGLNYNSPSFFAFWDHKKIALSLSCASYLAIIFSFFFAFTVLFFVCKNRKEVTDLVVILTAALLVVGIPFFLPRMHDRYFYFADVMTLICAFLIPKMIPAALLTEFASYLGYYAYLRGKYFLLLRFGSIALILVLIMLFFSLFRLLYSKQSHSFKFFRAK